MEMILEGSNSAEASPPSGGGTGSHRLSLRDGSGGLVVNFFDGFLNFNISPFIFCFVRNRFYQGDQNMYVFDIIISHICYIYCR